MKILVLTSRFPFPLEKGDKLRIYHQMRELARAGHEIVLIALAETPVSDTFLEALKPFCSRVYALKLTKIAILGNILRNILRGPRLPFQVAYFFNSNINRHIQSIISDEKPDHIYCHLVRMSEYVKNENLPKTLDFMDAFGAGTERRAAISPLFLRPLWRFEAQLMLNYERNIAPHFSNLTIISEQDRERLPISTKAVSVVGNGVDIDFFNLINYNKKEKIRKNQFIKDGNQLIKDGEKLIKDNKLALEINNKELENNNKLLESNKESVKTQKQIIKYNNLLIKANKECQEAINYLIEDNRQLAALNKELMRDKSIQNKQYDICFVGNLGYYSNVEAVRFLITHIVPLLKKEKPDIKILLAGARPTAEIQGFANENITVIGWLDDIRAAYADSRILVAPLMHGIGQQNKILEAMAMGVPVVSTSRVNNAIGATPETEILVADTEESFAEQIFKLLQDIDLQILMSKNGRAFVEQNYSWEGATRDLVRLITPQYFIDFQ